MTLLALCWAGCLGAQVVPVPARAAADERSFVSTAVEQCIAGVKAQIADQRLAEMFAASLALPLDRNVRFGMRDGKPDTFVAMGGSTAMGLADAVRQVWPYLQMMKDDEKLRQMVAGLINRQMACIAIDPYANAFNDGATGEGWVSDQTDRSLLAEVSERKWELSSLSYPLRLAYAYWKATGDDSVFGATWIEAVTNIVTVLREQQRQGDPGPYFFLRTTDRAADTKANMGWGGPVRYTGMVASAFRPSGEATVFDFHIPSNLTAVSALRKAAEILDQVNRRESLSARCSALANRIEEGIRQYGIAELPGRGLAYALEVDGYGNRLLMDPADMDGLLALAALGDTQVYDPLYLSAREFSLSADNPCFIRGAAGEGLCTPGVGRYDMIHPVSVILRALTSNDDAEIAACLGMLRKTGLPQAFHKDDPLNHVGGNDPAANALFAELVLKLIDEGKPVRGN